MENITINIGSAILYYVNGMFENARDPRGMKMIVEIMQEGVGYKIHEQHGMRINGKVCDGRYVRIIDLDLFVPKYIYIKNKKVINNMDD